MASSPSSKRNTRRRDDRSIANCQRSVSRDTVDFATGLRVDTSHSEAAMGVIHVDERWRSRLLRPHKPIFC